jgi:hypothetical protein
VRSRAGGGSIFSESCARRRSGSSRRRDPKTSEIVWQYTDPALFDFFSPYISGGQRLANGNTLICEGIYGRLFEVTHAGEVVWEYVNPYFFADPARPGVNNRVLRASRYTEDEIAAARRA